MAEASAVSKEPCARKLRPKCSPTSVIGPIGLFDSPGSSIAEEEQDLYVLERLESRPQEGESGSEAPSSSGAGRSDERTGDLKVTYFTKHLGPAGLPSQGAEVQEDDSERSQRGKKAACLEPSSSGRCGEIEEDTSSSVDQRGNKSPTRQGYAESSTKGRVEPSVNVRPTKPRGRSFSSVGGEGGGGGGRHHGHSQSMQLDVRPEDDERARKLLARGPDGLMKVQQAAKEVPVPGWTYGKHGFQTLSPRAQPGTGTLNITQLKKTLEMTRPVSGVASRREVGLPPRGGSGAGSLWIKALEKKAVKSNSSANKTVVVAGVWKNAEPAAAYVQTPEWRDPDPSLWDSYSGHLKVRGEVGTVADEKRPSARPISENTDLKIWESVEEEKKEPVQGSVDGTDSDDDDAWVDRRKSMSEMSNPGVSPAGSISSETASGPLKRLQQAASKAMLVAGNARRSCTGGMTVGGSRRSSDERSRVREKTRVDHPARSRWVSWLQRAGLLSPGRSSKRDRGSKSFSAAMASWKQKADTTSSPKRSIVTCYTF